MKTKITLKHIMLSMIITLSLANAFGETNKYWVKLNNKGHNDFSLENPEAFLSARSLERRANQDIPLDSTDLPVSKYYVDSIEKLGVEIIVSSKWLNGVTIQTSDPTKAISIQLLSFVDTVIKTWTDAVTKSAHMKFESDFYPVANEPEDYGVSYTQIAMHNGQKMHEAGYRGEGMLIAVLDGGFQNAPDLLSLSHLFEGGQIEGFRDFVNPGGSVFEDNSDYSHGTNVLSCMGGYAPGIMVGTAFKANFWLMRTEENATEFPVEMDYWVAGAELADSVGADLINSSLGYYAFDDPTMNYTWEDMDGKTTRCSQAASMAVEKGILVVNSAGNEGTIAYGKLIAPSDGIDVLCVGSVNKDSTYTAFSSRGPSADGRVKPDVAANGALPVVQGADGGFYYSNGTSFSSPIMCGLMAILWQSLPFLSSQDLVQLVHRNGNQFSSPDEYLGYGIPNIYQAYQSVVSVVSISGKSDAFATFPNPFSSTIQFRFESISEGQVPLNVYTVSGQLVDSKMLSLHAQTAIYENSTLQLGMYVIEVIADGLRYTKLMHKNE